MTRIRGEVMNTPNTDYASLLQTTYGIAVPNGAPKYQAEHLFRYAGMNSKEKLFAEAKRLFDRYPMWNMTLDQVLEVPITRG